MNTAIGHGQDKGPGDTPVTVHEENLKLSIKSLELLEEESDAGLDKRVRHKFDRHILPWLFGIWLFSFLDRSNIGNANIAGISQDLKLVGTEYNLALMLFFIPYILVDIPSNWILKYCRAGYYLPGLITCWGVVCTCMGFTKSLGGLIACRVLLGLFEGGLVPGILIYLAMFYRRTEMAYRIGIFYCAAPLSSAFGGLLASGLAKIEVGSYRKWPWIFFVEGAATVLVGATAALFLPDSISHAKFLTEEERGVAHRRVEGDAQGATGASGVEQETFSWHWVRIALACPLPWLSSLGYLMIIVPLYSYALFLPTIVHSLGYTSTTAQLLTAPPNVLGFISVLIVTRLSDRASMRAPFMIAGGLLVAIGYSMLLASDAPGVKYCATFFIASGLYPCSPLALAWLSNNSAPHYVRATTSGLQLSIGNFAAFIATYSYIAKDAPKYTMGHSINIGAACLFCAMTALTMFYCSWENKQRERGARDWRLVRQDPARLGHLHPEYRYSL
ncbi:uncharacterized protein Z520_03998 [Fonsecaea multimorphosa CBS 102226]|uniref:Major facilitator superfamily (MFS) profile domain-containing protein n=1 Tax=Fonsecaea multimorphosa CBS 102226 TaxID=1442371 RepID=A0A0D2K3A9_9EURO|nr:uncharacterized protein Z520_03998 [Fonsecaea multimorphosa CBS 102226]KIY00313.1 hypothetical protein Z520_03998 [Fonsecaea multimorphosa CBS 102226]OAL27145.1 hypothetical protein AYO22_03776 [Fonsecaea multimorphosa]